MRFALLTATRKLASHCPWRLVLLCLMGISSFSGCAYRNFSREFAAPALEPFSESGELPQPNRWWTEFDDPGLNREVERALGGNLTLSAALGRLEASRAVARREASNWLPDVDFFLATDAPYGPGNNPRSIAWGLDAAYQVDLWGQIGSRVEAEQFRADATAEDYQAVALSLAAEVTRTWFALVEAHAQLELLQDQIRTNRRGLKAQEERFQRGFVLSPDVLRQNQLVESTLEQEVVVRARIEVLEHQLAVLQGKLPQTAHYETGATLPGIPTLPAAGLPAELVMRRPDVRRDYMALRAADRDLAAAISDQYPRLSLTGSVVNAATSPETVFRDWFVSIGSQVVSPLLDGGQRRAEVDRTNAVLGQRFDQYGQSMLVAFQEVEDSLARERFQIQRIQKLIAQRDLAQVASERLFQQYLIGDADYLDVLSAIQSQQRLQRETLSARLDLILIRVGLYLALAGGIDTPPQYAAGTPADLPPARSGPSLVDPDRDELPPPRLTAPETDLDE